MKRTLQALGVFSLAIVTTILGAQEVQVAATDSNEASAKPIPPGSPGGDPLSVANTRAWLASIVQASQLGLNDVLPTAERDPPDTLLSYLRGEVDAPVLPEPTAASPSN